MAGKRKQQPQQAQEAQQAELDRLMHLSLSEIEKLPEDKQQLVYDELARQAAEIGLPEQLDKLAAGLEKLMQIPKTQAEALQSLLQKWDEAQRDLQRQWEALQKKIDFGQFAEVTRQLSEYGPILQPYIHEIYDADPERWGRASIPEMYAAAVKRARADGHEVPPLWFETRGEQLAMQLDIPEETASKKEEPAEASPAEILEQMRTVQAISVAAHIMPNTALMNTLQQKPAINAGPFDLVIAKEQARRKEITNYTIVSYDPGQGGVQITDPHLSEYERQVSDAVISLWAAADKQKMPPVFTIDDIYQSMPGGGGKPSPAQRGAITKTMEKFARLHIYMDATEEMQRRRQTPEGQQFIIDEDYMNWRRYTVQTRNGRKITQGYELLGRPIMLTYSMLTNQTLTVNAEQLAIRKIKGGAISPELVSMSAGRQAMTGYMLRRIAVIKHDAEAAKDAYRQYEKRRRREPELEARPLAAFRKQSPVILFDTLFAEAGTATTDRKQAGLNRAFCYDVLAYWQATGFIKGYAEQRKGKKITGFSILL